MNITLYIYIQIYVYICGCESVSMYSYIYLHFCMWMYTCTHLCVHRHKSTLTAACERTNAHMRLINTCDSFIHMTWLIHMSDMTHSDARISHAKHHPLSHKWVTYSDLPGQAGLRTRATMSRMNRYHTWMVASHGTYVWVTYEWMTHIIYVSSRDYVTYEYQRVMAHIKRVMSHMDDTHYTCRPPWTRGLEMWMSHITSHMSRNESWHICRSHERVDNTYYIYTPPWARRLEMWMSHDTNEWGVLHMNCDESWHIRRSHEWVDGTYHICTPPWARGLASSRA